MNKPIFTTKVFTTQAVFTKTMQAALTLSLVLVSNFAAANISENDIKQFAQKMHQSANSKNIAQVSRLIGDDALISISRRGVTSTLDKSSYLNLLQTNWAKATDYRYTIHINNVISTGDQAKADIVTTEVISENGKTLNMTTTSRATFSQTTKGVVLSRAISQLTIQ
ncbi:hypothetical protein MOMA_07536 [Moraxella macacae 0408225]|uniref:DUF4440 domain-containing protein n=1 Tax=Moraxella macacae 0408225 TaxID=1230338 RepID=L2F661_9GAMM|nr:hypothetical protein [Moraxella macacae]ELA08395.1 hypothetical protein MOMA_07536 [Moraxella macacae 0408225]